MYPSYQLKVLMTGSLSLLEKGTYPLLERSFFGWFWGHIFDRWGTQRGRHIDNEGPCLILGNVFVSVEYCLSNLYMNWCRYNYLWYVNILVCILLFKCSLYLPVAELRNAYLL